MISRLNLARDVFLLNKGSDWLSDSASSRWAWLHSKEEGTLEFNCLWRNFNEISINRNVDIYYRFV